MLPFHNPNARIDAVHRSLRSQDACLGEQDVKKLFNPCDLSGMHAALSFLASASPTSPVLSRTVFLPRVIGSRG